MLPVRLCTVCVFDLKLCWHCHSPFAGAVLLPRASSALTRVRAQDRMFRCFVAPNSSQDVSRLQTLCPIRSMPIALQWLRLTARSMTACPPLVYFCVDGRVQNSYAHSCFLSADITASFGGMPPASLPLLALPVQVILCAASCTLFVRCLCYSITTRYLPVLARGSVRNKPLYRLSFVCWKLSFSCRWACEQSQCRRAQVSDWQG